MKNSKYNWRHEYNCETHINAQALEENMLNKNTHYLYVFVFMILKR